MRVHLLIVASLTAAVLAACQPTAATPEPHPYGEMLMRVGAVGARYESAQEHARLLNKLVSTHGSEICKKTAPHVGMSMVQALEEGLQDYKDATSPWVHEPGKLRTEAIEPIRDHLDAMLSIEEEHLARMESILDDMYNRYVPVCFVRRRN